VARFGYKNPMEVPKLVKIVVNMGVGEAVQGHKVLGEGYGRPEGYNGTTARGKEG
jgi:large subunit ribosomal protein L5